MSSPSLPPPAYVGISSCRHGNSTEGIPLPPYQSQLFANYHSDKKTPEIVTAAVSHSVAGDVEAQAQTSNCSTSEPCRDLGRRQQTSRERPSSRQCRAMILACLAISLALGIIWLARLAYASHEEEPNDQ